MRIRGIALLSASILVVGISFISALPADDKAALHTQGALHPYLHLFAFACVSSLIALGVRSPQIRILLLLGLVVFGWATEFGEHLLEGYPVELPDVFADTVGAVLGSVLVSFRNR